MEENVDDVKRMLDFLYTDSYWEHAEEERGKTSSEELYQRYKETKLSEDWVDENKENDPVMVNARMFVLADKLEIPALKSEVLKKVKGFWKAVKYWKRLPHVPGLPVGINCPEFPVSLEDETHCVLTHWKRLLDTADYALSRAPNDPRLADLLLQPVARVAPGLSQQKGNKYFADLMRRLSQNGDLGLRIFPLTCKEVGEKERETARIMERRDELAENFRDQVTVLMNMFAEIVKRPEKREDLRCYSDGCPVPQIMVPVYEYDDQDAELEWVCKCCGIRCTVGSGAIDPGIQQSRTF